ncbi:MAG TPA: protein phosphatase 2C domain-containing protein [Povalibacter sp.]|uniref:PP2C family protein-serine/threonine phosphatase n=1 Tax=Povalibacter sp. TaxID=1962978 RepID=UPI002CE34137|nr:protein phosphatase 2C domain-containing protein [Povalibacter sp.]HMN45849.1 protein phosphatase 2C domain-containing protein [Povalibacter sp.]
MLEDTLVEEDIHPVYVSAALTHTGKVRESNQDGFVDRADAGLWAVADGMGGHMEGDVASRMVCDALAAIAPASKLDGTLDDIQRRASEVNTRLYAAAIRPINPVQSGSTVVVFAVQRTACAILWAGDSRVYRLRHDQLAQMTTDHTWAAQIAPMYGSEEVEELDHSIMRAVGGEQTLVLDVRRDRVRLGDRYLLCSDGLTRELPPDRIAALLGEGTVQDAAQALIDATLAAGARDNVTVVVIEAT